MRRAMKTSLDHLPEKKQHQVRALGELIRKEAEVEMVILFGSFARGDWVEDPVGGYFSPERPTEYPIDGFRSRPEVEPSLVGVSFRPIQFPRKLRLPPLHLCLEAPTSA